MIRSILVEVKSRQLNAAVALNLWHGDPQQMSGCALESHIEFFLYILALF